METGSNQSLEDQNRSVLLGGERSGSARHVENQRMRLERYVDWLNREGRHWSAPDFAAYLRDLETHYRPSTVKGYMQAVLARYTALLKDPERLQVLLSERSDLRSTMAGGSILQQLRDAVENAPRRAQSAAVRAVFLSHENVRDWLEQPDLYTRTGKRDVALMALAVSTGIREPELVALDVPDLSHTVGTQRALRVPACQGCDERFVVPGKHLDWGIKLAEFWADRADIDKGPLFCAFHRNEALRSGRLSVRSLGFIFSAYPITMNGERYVVKPSDCRRYFATRQYYSGVDVRLIQANLGFRDLNSVMAYVQPEAEWAGETEPYEYDLTKLNAV